MNANLRTPVDVPESLRLVDRRPVIVVSGVNLTAMGGLSILRDCLGYLAERADEYDTVALVHNKNLVDVPKIQYHEFPLSKRSIFARIYHEYWMFGKLSRRLNPLLWLSLHNTTPNVHAQRRAVYCQNAIAFYDLTWREAFMQPRFALVRMGMDLMYRLNLHQNAVIIVQQEWMRQALRRRFGVDNIIVAHPVLPEPQPVAQGPQQHRPSPFIFFYPSFPTINKNFEVICNSVRYLIDSGIADFEVWLTFSPSTNRYARHISESIADLPQVRLLGTLSREEVYRRYALTDCLLFPSKVETWGLAISEFRPYNRPMLIADAAYARETVGDHPCVAFFPSDSAKELANRMKEAMQGASSFARATAPKIAPPFARSWAELFNILLDAEPMTTTRIDGSLVRDSLSQRAAKSV